MEQILTAVLSSSVIATIVSQIISIIQKRIDSRNGFNDGVRLILKDRLRFLCVHYIEQGWIYEDELEDLIAMHTCYHDKLGGNGYLDTLMERVKKLDIRGIGI